MSTLRLLGKLLGKPAAVAAVMLPLLWTVFGLYQTGRPVWAATALALGSVTVWIYASARTLAARYLFPDRKSTRLNSSHVSESRMPSSA